MLKLRLVWLSSSELRKTFSQIWQTCGTTARKLSRGERLMLSNSSKALAVCDPDTLKFFQSGQGAIVRAAMLGLLRNRLIWSAGRMMTWWCHVIIILSLHLWWPISWVPTHIHNDFKQELLVLFQLCDALLSRRLAYEAWRLLQFFAHRLEPIVFFADCL